MSPDEAIAKIAAKQHGAFDHAQAIRAGISTDAIRHRCVSGRWFVPHRGVYVIAGAPPRREQDVLAAVLAYGAKAAASHTDSGWLLGLVSSANGPVDVMMPYAQHREHRRGVRTHQALLIASDVRTVSNIRVTAPNRTIVDLAGVLRQDDLEAALDAAILSRLTTAARLQRYVQERNLDHKRGAKRLADLLVDRLDGAMQLALERMFHRKLARSRLPKPRRQFPVNGRKIDFAYPETRIAIELDGLARHATGAVFRDDRRRQNMLVLAGWLPLRFTYADVDEAWPDVEATIAQALAERTRVAQRA